MLNSKSIKNADVQQVYSEKDTRIDDDLISEKKKTKGKENKLSFIILVGLVALLPFFFIPFSIFSFYFSKAILISLVTVLLFILWIIDRLQDGEFPLTANPILIIGAVIPVVYLLSSLFSGSVMTSLIGQGYELDSFVFVLVLFLLMFLTVNIIKTKERVYYLFFSFLISCLIVSLFQIARLIMGPEFLSFGILTDPTINLIGKWNELSIFFGLTVILSLLIIEFMNNSKAIIKIFSYVVLAMSLFFVALVNFSTVWIVLGIFAFILVAYIISSNKFNLNKTNKSKTLESRNFPVASLLIVLLSLVFVLGNNNIGNSLSGFFDISSSEVRPSWQGTTDIAKGTLETRKAVLGVGPNKFVNQWLKYKPARVNNTIFWNTDFNTGVSTIYSSLVTVGLVGFLSWLLFLSLLSYTGFKFIFIPSEDKVGEYLLPLSFLLTVYLWLFSIIYVPTHVIVSLTFIFTGVLISLLIQNNAIKIKKISFIKNQRADFVLVLFLIFLMVASVIGGYVISQKFIASAYYQKALIEINDKEGDIEKIEENVIKAINLSGNDSYYRFLSEINLVKLQGLLAKKDLSGDELSKQFQSLLSGAVQSSQKATEIDKTNYQNWMSLGRVYENIISFDVPGAYEQALDSYTKAVNLNPKSPVLMFSLGILEFNNKNFEKAMPILENAVILKPDYSDAKYYLGLSYYQLDRVDDAILQFKDLVILNPENSEVKTILKNLEEGYTPFRGMQGTQTPQASLETSETETETEIEEENSDAIIIEE